LKEDKPQAFHPTVDEDVAFLYASAKCKHCYGRGVIKTLIPGTILDEGEVTAIDYCRCVGKNKRKYG